METHVRLAVVAGLCLTPLAPLSLRLAQLQVMQHQRIDKEVINEVVHTTAVAADRADIVDRRGRLLARSVPFLSCFVERPLPPDTAALAACLGRILAMPPAEVLRRLQGRERRLYVMEDVSAQQAAALAEAKLKGKKLISYGVGVELRHRRFYPRGDLALNVLGKVGTDQNGLSGVELTFDSRLRGRARRLRYLRDGIGRIIYRDAEVRPETAQPLALSLDRDSQFHAEEVLHEAAAQFHAKGGMIVVLDPATSEVLAMAALPSDRLKNPIIQDPYEPGSTFKLIAAAAALEESLVDENQTFFCENGSYDIAPGVRIHDHEPAGLLTLQGILERSSNIGISKVVERVGARRFYSYSRAFGFDIKTGIDLPGETAGEMKPFAHLTRVVLAASSYGYGIGASALQVANAYSAIANGGTLYEPSILAVSRRPQPVRRVVSEATARTVTHMLESVVERGTGMSGRIPGYRVAGKTGTARKLDPRTHAYSTNAYMASFVGFLPASRPLWTILVVIDDPKGQYYGAQVAAPVFAKLGRRLLTMAGVPPDQPAVLAGRP